VKLPRVVITGVGLASPNGDDLAEFRRNLLDGVSGVESYEIGHVGPTPAGVCHFDPLKYQKKKEVRRGTRAGSVSVWCAHEALADAGLDLDGLDRSRVGIYTGITEHGNVETETQVLELAQYDYDLAFWSHHHNPRTVANNPAGEASLNLGITGPAYSLGGACAAGNLGLIHGMQMLQLGQVDLALGGGVSESIRAFGIFAGFRAQGALATHEDPAKASRPFDRDRNGIVVSEGGCLFALERLEDALERGARIHGEVAGYAVNSDAADFVLPDSKGQAACIRAALASARMEPGEVDILNTHATSTPSGDEVECAAVREVFADSPSVHVNNTKSYIGHAMGAAGALELAGNLPSFEDGLVHPTINLDNLDPACELPGLVRGEPLAPSSGNGIRTILNMSFGMLGINSAVVVKRYDVS
jgi:3-oxoacyl-[acyl-carrier-protein] synthase II